MRPRDAARAARLVLLVLISTIFAPAAAWAAEPVAIQLSWQHQFQFAGYYVALERGHYRAAGLDVEIRPGGPAALSPIEAVRSGRAEFGVDNAGISVARMDGAPVVALAAVLQSSPAVWVAAGLRDRFDLEDWRHLARRLPFEPSRSTELLIPFLREGQLAGSDSLPSAPAKAAGTAEMRAAYLSLEVNRLTRSGAEFTVLDPRDFGVDFYSEILFTSESQLRLRPATVSRFREASLLGWAEAFEDVEGTAKMIQARYAPSRPLEDLVEEGKALRRLARVDAVELGHMSEARWKAIGRLQHTHGFGREPLDVAGFVRHASARQAFLWPDPVRVTFAGLLVALLLSAIQLLRVNGSLVRENRRLADTGRHQQAAELRFQFLMDVAPFPIAIFELADGRVLYANDRALGWSGAAEMVAQPIGVWIPALAPGAPPVQRLLAGRSLHGVEIELTARGGEPERWCSLNGRAIEYEGRHCAFVAFSDITDRKRAEREAAILSEQRALILRDVETLQLRLRESSVRDALTGLHNRRYFDTTAEREFARCRREGLLLGLLVVDADHFKQVNDRYGHAGGDEVLRALGGLLLNGFRAGDVVCRYGGEEFVVLMPGAESDVVLARAEALRNEVAGCGVLTTAGEIRFTVSIGAAVGDPTTSTPAELFELADQAVYAAKAAGRNCVRAAQAPMPATVLSVAGEPGARGAA